MAVDTTWHGGCSGSRCGAHFAPTHTKEFEVSIRNALSAIALAPIVASTFTLAAPAAHAYNPMTVGNCSVVTWPSNPRVILHVLELDGFTVDMEDAMLQAMEDIHAQVGAVGGSTAAITGFTLSATPFTFRTAYNDAVPTIHVGFTNDASQADGAAITYKDSSRCEITSANIQFMNPSSSDPDLVDWRFGEPADEGEDFWLDDHNLNTSAYFRISYMHELLHGWGLKHSPDSYSMMNYGTRPFANMEDGKQVRPLPDDREFLRDFYPTGVVSRGIAVLNTWFTATNVVDAAADQDGLCAPAKGSAWDAWNAGFCATNPTTLVCPGEWIYTQSAIANNGSDDLDVEHRLWFSLDESWTSADLASPTIRYYTVNGDVSSKQGRMFQVPSNAAYSTTYQPIARVSGTGSDGSIKSDWIPLRGTLTIKSRVQCGGFKSGAMPFEQAGQFD